MKKEIHVVGAIIVESRKVLCCQRRSERTLANPWGLPGGKVENGETKVRALERELQEELEIEVTIVREEYTFCRYEHDLGFVNLATFVCYLGPGGPQLTEHLQIKWLTPNELDQLEWAPADIPTVEKLIEKGVETEQNG